MNAINIIHPYKHAGMWVFDDDRVGLCKEPFVGGADSIIDLLTRSLDDAAGGFTLLFSAVPFPGSRHRVEWQRRENGGDVYLARELGVEGWLCPALLLYFASAPKEIYLQVKAKE